MSLKKKKGPRVLPTNTLPPGAGDFRASPPVECVNTFPDGKTPNGIATVGGRFLSIGTASAHDLVNELERLNFEKVKPLGKDLSANSCREIVARRTCFAVKRQSQVFGSTVQTSKSAPQGRFYRQPEQAFRSSDFKF
jgi:hypothetical protein